MHFKICAALLLITPAAFANNVDLKTQLQSCQQIADEEQRLSCFDQIVSRLDAMPVVVRELSADPIKAAELPAAPAVLAPAAPVHAPTPQSATAEFGLTKPEPAAEVAEITGIVKTAKLSKRKKLLITLENGQQWQQIDQDYLNIKAGDTCIIKRGTMGSFLLGVSGFNRTIRVRRVE